jgi:hypothetical protein
MRTFKKLTLILVALSLMVGLSWAQQPTGKILGKIVDDQGAALPGVAVTAESPKLIGTSSTVSDAEGIYRIFALPSGTYKITFQLAGFNTYIREAVFLQLEQTISLDITMQPSTVEEQITVIGQSPVIDVKSTVKGKTITREIFESLPRGRDFTGLLSIIPGVQYDGVAGGLSVDGATGTENMWYMDGTGITDIHVGLQDQSAAFEMVEEVQVKASGYPAEFGGSMGGVVNVITRSGGNAFHGDLYVYYNNNKTWMQGPARDFLRQDPFVDNQYEYVNNDDIKNDYIGMERDPYYRIEGVFNLGGYILKDKLWFYLTVNPVYSQTKALRQFTRPPPIEGQETFYRKNYSWNGQAKLTAQPIRGLRLTASYVNDFSKYRQSIPSMYGTSDEAFPWDGTGFDYPNWSGTFTADYTASNNLLLSLRGGYHMTNTTNQQLLMPTTRWYWYRNLPDAPPYDTIPEELRRTRGWNNWSTTRTEVNSYIFSRFYSNFDVTYYANLAGEHAFKAGAAYSRPYENVDNAQNHPGVYLLWDVTNYSLPAYGEDGFKGLYGYYFIISGGPPGGQTKYGDLWKIHSDQWSFYLQDSWTIGDKLTLQLGVRTESEYIPSFNNDPEYADVRPIEFKFQDKLSPRLGVIYDVFGDSSLKLFAHFGIYYDVMKLYMAEGAYGGFKWTSHYYALNNPYWLDIAASGDVFGDDMLGLAAPPVGEPNEYMGSMNWRLPSFDSTDPNLKPVAQREISFGAEKRLMEELTFSVRVVNKHLIRTIEDIGVMTSEGEKYFNANPGFGWSLPESQGGKFSDDFWPTPKATREYWGVNLALDKRFSDNWQGGINYTYSRVAGLYSGLSSSDEGGRNSPNVERGFDLWFMSYDMQGNPLDGPLGHDRTHYFKGYGSYAFPFGLTVGMTAYGRSGLPLTTRLSVQTSYMFPNNRGDLGRLPFTFWGDLWLEYNLRIANKYRFQINLTVNNFTNTSTWQGKDTTPTRESVWITDEQIMSGTHDWEAEIPTHDPDNAFLMYTSKFGTWSARLGFRFSF